MVTLKRTEQNLFVRIFKSPGILVTCVIFHQVNSFIDCMFYLYCFYYRFYFLILYIFCFLYFVYFVYVIITAALCVLINE